MKKSLLFTSITLLFLLNTPLVMAKEKNSMHKLIFVLQITDIDKYNNYRESITPLMERLNIVVLNEYTISEVIQNKDPSNKVNRLAVFGFPTEDSKSIFFSDPDYLKAKKLFTESTTNFVKLVE